MRRKYIDLVNCAPCANYLGCPGRIWVGSLNPVHSVWMYSTAFYRIGSGWSLAVDTLSRVTIAAAASVSPLRTSAMAPPMESLKLKYLVPRCSSWSTPSHTAYSQHGCIKNRGTLARVSTAIKRLTQKKKRFQFHMDRICSVVPNRVLVFVSVSKPTPCGGGAASTSPHKNPILRSQTQFAFPESLYPYKNPSLYA